MIDKLNSFIWGLPALFGILGIGLYLTIGSGFAQFCLFGKAAKHFFRQFFGKDQLDSPYRALCTALAATVGTGNIVGVAGAIVIGGPGSIFWIWICGLIGMGIKFAEAALAVRYRAKNKKHEWIGGPMYMIKFGLNKHWHWLAGVYCVLGIVASFGVGNAAQVNAIVESVGMLSQTSAIPMMQQRYLIGVVLAVIVAAVLLGGARRIGQLAEQIVPLAAGVYIFLSVLVLLLCRKQIPNALRSIVIGAFDPKSVTGGVLGCAFMTLKIGASRGTFTNEAGMGTAAIAHGSANANHPVEQGFMGIMEVFIDTLVICTMTALVILCSGIRIPYGEGYGATLTVDAFSFVLGRWITPVLIALILLFAVATILGWSLYGIRCIQYLFGEHSWRMFVFAQVAIVAVAALARTQTVWLVSELFNGLMLIPNLIALFILSPVFFRLIQAYRSGSDSSAKTLTKIHK